MREQINIQSAFEHFKHAKKTVLLSTVIKKLIRNKLKIIRPFLSRLHGLNDACINDSRNRKKW